MICKFCGTESTGNRCPNCGMHMNDQVSAPPPMPPKVNVAPVQKSAPAKPAKHKNRSVIGFKKIFWPAVALLLPIAYLIFDAYAVVSSELMVGDAMERLLALLSNASYESIPLGELAGSVLGQESTVVEVISPYLLIGDLLSGAGEAQLIYLLPVGVVALLAVICAVSGLALLLTGGRILRSRFLADGILVGGVAASVAPLIGSFVLRLYYALTLGAAEADARMACVMPTLEWLLIMCILLCTLLPSMTTLRRLAARDGGLEAYISLPYSWGMKRAFKVVRVLTAVTTLLGVLPMALYMLLPTLTTGAPLDTVRDTDALLSVGREFAIPLAAIFGGEDVDFALWSRAALSVGVIIMVGVLVLSFLDVLIDFVRILATREEIFCNTKGKKKILKNAHAHVRSMLVSPLVVMGIFYTLVTAIMLLVSPVALHLDFGNVYETLGVVYVIAIYVKSLCGFTTLYGLIALAGAALWRMTANLGAAAVFRAGKR